MGSMADERGTLDTDSSRDGSPGHRGGGAQGLRAPCTYVPGEGPEVLVQVGGDWHGGELREWTRDPEGNWWAQVIWRRPLGQTFVGTFPRQRVWEDDDIVPEA